VEERLVGGECDFYACMPSKALLNPGEILDEVRRVPGAREAADGQLAVQAVLDNRDSIISGLDDSAQVPWLEDNGISLYRGHGRVAGDKRVVVGDEELRAKVAVVIAIGSQPTLPDVEGLSQARPWTNREATTSKVVPGRLLIVGGGVVGAEMAQAYTSLGAKVTLLARGTQLLAKEEPWAAEQVAARLREQGAEIVAEAEIAKVEPAGGAGEVTVQLQDGRSFAGDELLVAVGRHIDSGQLGLDTIGLRPGAHGYLAVDEHLQVPGHDWLWVVGDANGRALLTHMAKHQARVAAGSRASPTPRSGRSPTALARRE
jgi:pyruvate/2-oxoglutarate dehydrogenase complex dihydrolipoamide dehydrogenase (E3) component